MDKAVSPDQVWEQAKELLALQMTKATFDTWLRGSWAISADGDQWVIGVFHAYAVDWLTNRLGTVISRTLGHVAGGPVTVRFEVGRPPGGLGGLDQSKRRVDTSRSMAESAEVDSAPIIEAVREQRVTVSSSGGALQWVDFYIKLKVAFRKRALRRLKGAKLSVFICLALHVDRDGIAKPGGIEAIMHETDYSRGAVCSALADLDGAGLIKKIPQHHGPDHYAVLGYAWFGQQPAPALWELGKKSKSKK